jgi:hypothetical protein
VREGAVVAGRPSEHRHFPCVSTVPPAGATSLRSSLPPNCTQLLVRPWSDPVIDQIGYDARSPYVERFWLGVLGPSATWFLRYVADRFDAAAEGFDLDIGVCASAIGLGRPWGPTAAFPRMVNRLCQFGVARMLGRTTMEVRRTMPPLTRKQVERLPEALRVEHSRWVDQAPAAAQAAALRDRARRLALSLLELGEQPDAAERQLLRWRFPDRIAREATTWAIDRHGVPALASWEATDHRDPTDAPRPALSHTQASSLPPPVGGPDPGDRAGREAEGSGSASASASEPAAAPAGAGAGAGAAAGHDRHVQRG